MRMRWSELTFLHWPYEPERVQRLLPSGLTVETFDDAAWVGLVPFRMTVRASRGPAVPWVSFFPETNVRTYVRAPDGTTGIWFFSLDAAQLGAVLTARAWLGLPYEWARMAVRMDGGGGEGRSSDTGARGTTAGPPRRAPRPRPTSTADMRIGPPIDRADVSDLEEFLTARFRLYSVVRGSLLSVPAEHGPWPLHRARDPRAARPAGRGRRPAAAGRRSAGALLAGRRRAGRPGHADRLDDRDRQHREGRGRRELLFLVGRDEQDQQAPRPLAGARGEPRGVPGCCRAAGRAPSAPATSAAATSVCGCPDVYVASTSTWSPAATAPRGSDGGYGKGPEPLGRERRHRALPYASQPGLGHHLARGEGREGDPAGSLGDASERAGRRERLRDARHAELVGPYGRPAGDGRCGHHDRNGGAAQPGRGGRAPQVRVRRRARERGARQRRRGVDPRGARPSPSHVRFLSGGGAEPSEDVTAARARGVMTERTLFGRSQAWTGPQSSW